MNNTEIQILAIEKLDSVVAKVESIILNKSNATTLDFESLKKDIQELYNVVDEAERLSRVRGGDINSIKDTISKIKQSVENSKIDTPDSVQKLEEIDVIEENLCHEQEEKLRECANEELIIDIQEELFVEEENIVIASEQEMLVVDCEADSFVDEKDEKQGTLFPEKAVEKKTENFNSMLESIEKANQERFSYVQDEGPSSYITAFAKMTQANMKKEDVDLSISADVAVSSTAMPIEKPAQEDGDTRKDNLLSSLRSTKANMHGGQLRTMVDKFKAPQTLYDVQQSRLVDLRSSVGVNEKFLISNELFNGSIKEFTEIINKLNDIKEPETALVVWLEIKQKYMWNEETLAYMTFYDILKRRFPNFE